MIKVGIIDYCEDDRHLTRSLLPQAAYEDQELPIEFVFDEAQFEAVTIGAKPSPDIVLLELEGQPDRIVAQVDNALPDSHIVVVTHQSDPNILRHTFRNGAVSYLLKSDRASYLDIAVGITFHHGSFVSPKVCRALIDQAYLRTQYESLLTAREQQVARGIVEGLSYKMIAGQYDISLDTVRAYVKRVYRKLNINSKSQLMAQLRF